MINEKDMGALINQIREVTRDHIDWIKSQLLKPNNFMIARGREVFIDVPNSNLKNIVTIPNKNDPKYKEAWARVYNLAVDYLEGVLSLAYMKGRLNYKDFKWPEFKEENADYARGLEKVLDEYKAQEIARLKAIEDAKKLKVVKSSVVLTPVSVPEEAKKTPKENAINENDIKEKTESIDVKPVSSDTNLESFSFQKILDGDKISNRDIRELQDIGSKLVMVPCLDLDNIKEEKLFLENMHMCNDENVMAGAMIYGKATDEKDAGYELKKILKLLDQFPNNSRCVIYEVNDKFASKNKDAEMRLLSFINAYTLIAEGLSKEGYIPILSMNLSSRKILNDIYGRYKLSNKFEIIYRVLVRELDELNKNDSTILMDPQYDYDVITFRNPRYNSAEVIKNDLNRDKVLAKAA